MRVLFLRDQQCCARQVDLDLVDGDQSTECPPRLGCV
jgi:hypothetical protein